MATNRSDPTYAIALLARGAASDWQKLSKAEQEDLAADMFEAVDKDRSGAVDKSELFDSLAHGSVSVPHSIIETIFETLDINGDGLITMDEWCDNFEVYLKCLVKQQSSNRKAAEGSQPLWPSARSAGLKFGIPRGASSSTRSLPVSIGQRAALASRGAQSTRSMIQTPGMASRRSGRGFSDTACDYAEGVQSSSASWTSGQRRPSQADALSTKSLSNRRLSLLMEETPIRSAGTGPRSPAAKQSDRSVVPLVRDKKKEAHFIVGHAGLNRRSDSDAFKAKLVRRKSLKALLGVFKGINLRSNGTISRQEFEHYLRWNAKDLLPHAKGIYSACTAKCPKARAAESDVDVHDLLDFAQLLRVLYPGADADDLRELLELVDKPKAPLVVDWSDKVTECRGLFNMYNVSKDGWMTPDEFSEGMEKLDMDEDDMEFHYNDLFPVTGGMRPINFAKFFQWYTGHELPEEYANESNFDVKVAL